MGGIARHEPLSSFPPQETRSGCEEIKVVGTLRGCEKISRWALAPCRLLGVRGRPARNGLRKTRGRDARGLRHDLAPNRFPRESDANSWRLISLRGCDKIPWQGLPAAAPECCGWKPQPRFTVRMP